MTIEDWVVVPSPADTEDRVSLQEHHLDDVILIHKEDGHSAVIDGESTGFRSLSTLKLSRSTISFIVAVIYILVHFTLGLVIPTSQSLDIINVTVDKQFHAQEKSAQEELKNAVNQTLLDKNYCLALSNTPMDYLDRYQASSLVNHLVPKTICSSSTVHPHTSQKDLIEFRSRDRSTQGKLNHEIGLRNMNVGTKYASTTLRTMQSTGSSSNITMTTSKQLVLRTEPTKNLPSTQYRRTKIKGDRAMETVQVQKAFMLKNWDHHGKMAFVPSVAIPMSSGYKNAVAHIPSPILTDTDISTSTIYQPQAVMKEPAIPTLRLVGNPCHRNDHALSIPSQVSPQRI